MAGRLRTFKPDEQIVQKVCENPDCERQFFVTSRYAQSTRFCCNKCLQHTFYLSRKLRERAAVENELQDIETDNNLNINDMDAMEKILAMKDELNELKTKLLLQERDMQDLNRIKTELASIKQENDDLEAKLEAYKNQLEEYQESNQDIAGEANELSQKVKSLSDDKMELIFANLVLQSRGTTDYSGGHITFDNVKQYLPEFKGKKDENFTLSVWNWQLTHEAGSENIVIQNIKSRKQ